MKKTIGISLGLLVLFSILLYFIVSHSEIYSVFFDRQRLAQFIKSFGSVSPLIFIALQVFQVLFAPIPGEVTGFLGGFIYGNFFGLLYSTIGLGIGSWLAFIFARWVGRPLVERIINPKTMERYDYLMAHQGTWIAFPFFNPRISQRLSLLPPGAGPYGFENLFDYLHGRTFSGNGPVDLPGSSGRRSDLQYRRTGVKNHAVAGANERCGATPMRRFLSREGWDRRQLTGAAADARHCAAVHPLEIALALQAFQVTADGGLGDSERRLSSVRARRFPV